MSFRVVEKSGASEKIESETGVSDYGVMARAREYTLRRLASRLFRLSAIRVPLREFQRHTLTFKSYSMQDICHMNLV